MLMDAETATIQVKAVPTTSHKLTEEKARRKRADFLLNHLTNRLNFLKREEAKALLSVSQARQKAYQITQIRHFSATHKAEISLQRRKSLQSEVRQKDLNTQRTIIAGLRKTAACRLVQVYKRRDVKAINRMKEVLEDRGREQWREEMARRRGKIRTLRREGGEVPLRIEMYQREKQDRVGEWRRYRLLSELEHRNRQLEAISDLEQERLSLTQRLINVSTQQSQADSNPL